MVYKVKVNTRDELLECILDDAKHINNIRVLLTDSHSILKWARLCIQAESGYFEHLL